MKVFMQNAGGFLKRGWLCYPRSWRVGMGITMGLAFAFAILGMVGIIPQSIVFWK